MRVGWRLLAVLVLGGPLVVSGALPARAGGVPGFAETVRASLTGDGTQANAMSSRSAVSGDGRFVAFVSAATNLVPGGTNGLDQVFVRDQVTGVTSLVSVATDGTQADGDNFIPTISADGRFVAFASFSSNLVRADTNGDSDVFVRDRLTGTTTRVSVASDGTQGNDVSGDPRISADGTFVAFYSFATNLVPHDTNGSGDVFVHDLLTGNTSRASVGNGGVQGNGESAGPAISADGRFVAFDSGATNLVPNDTNGKADIFVRDRLRGTTSLVSVATNGTQGDDRSLAPAISADGRFVAFGSDAQNLVAGVTSGVTGVYVRDRLAGTTTRADVADDGTQADAPLFGYLPAISGDGRFIAFASFATNLVVGDNNHVSDIFVRDRWARTTARVSVSTFLAQANDFSFEPSISLNGRYVGFTSAATNLVRGDTNGVNDIFVRFRGA